MTSRDEFAAGNLDTAVALQRQVVANSPEDAASRLFLVELLAFVGEFDEACEQLKAVDSTDPEWPSLALAFRKLFRAETRRSHDFRLPLILPTPAPPHARQRRKAMACLREDRPDEALAWIDRAEAGAPEISGFLDGREFDRLRDADDRFASVLEAFVDGRYFWFAWEGIHRVKLAPAIHALDGLFRPAEIHLWQGDRYPVHIPLIYPDSHSAEGAFATGRETDRICPDDGPIRCIGGKLLIVGDDEEFLLSECRMIEIRG